MATHWEKQLVLYEKVIDLCPDFKRKGKTVPYTSANGHMFSQLNKDGEIGIRLSRESGEKFKAQYNTTGFTSYGANMRGYVLIPDELLGNAELLARYLNEGYQYVLSLDPK